MALEGLGGFGKNFLEAYSTMAGLDRQSEELRLKRQLAEEQAKLRALEEQKLRAAIEESRAEKESAGSLVSSLSGVPQHEQSAALPGLLAKMKDPYAALKAAKLYQEGTGGFLPATQRDEQRRTQEFFGIAAAQRSMPDKLSIDDVALHAARLRIPIQTYQMAFPEAEQRDQATKAFYNALNTDLGKGTSPLAVPGAPILPGARPALPSAPGSLVPTQRTIGEIEAGQAGRVAATRAGGEVTGRLDTLGAVSPIHKEPYISLEEQAAERIGAAKARGGETSLDQQKKRLEIELMGIEKTIKTAQAEQDPVKRAAMISDAMEKLLFSRQFISLIPKDDPMRKVYLEAFNNSLMLMQRGSLPGRAPVAPQPTAPQGVIKFGRDASGNIIRVK